VNDDEIQSNSQVQNWYIAGPVVAIIIALIAIFGLWLNRHSYKKYFCCKICFPGSADDSTNTETEPHPVNGETTTTEDTKPPLYCEVIMDLPAYNELFDNEGKQLPKSTESDENS
jgi:hypothetical protein